MLIYFKNVFKSFLESNIKSVGRQVAESLAVKVGGHKKSLPLGPGSTPTGSESFSKFNG